MNSDGRDLKDCTLPQDIKKFLIEVHDFSDEVPGEDIFPLFVPVVFVRRFTTHSVFFNSLIFINKERNKKVEPLC